MIYGKLFCGNHNKFDWNFKSILMKTLLLILVPLFLFGDVAAQGVSTIKDTVTFLNPNNVFGKTVKDSNEPFKWKSDNNHRNDSIKIFSLSPIYRKVSRVNGFALGFGHYENSRIKFQKINGLNVEASPLSLALVTFAINVPFEALFCGINDNAISNAAFLDDETPNYIQINGLNISSGGFMGGAKMNGLNISIFSGMNQMNGLSLSGVVLGTKQFNGLSIAGMANITDYGNGLQLAASNVSRNHKGIQIGLFNHSNNLRGMQFGLWNTNGKRKLPLVNWQFKKA